mgnify:CR=1 FL=1
MPFGVCKITHSGEAILIHSSNASGPRPRVVGGSLLIPLSSPFVRPCYCFTAMQKLPTLWTPPPICVVPCIYFSSIVLAARSGSSLKWTAEVSAARRSWPLPRFPRRPLVAGLGVGADRAPSMSFATPHCHLAVDIMTARRPRRQGHLPKRVPFRNPWTTDRVGWNSSEYAYSCASARGHKHNWISRKWITGGNPRRRAPRASCGNSIES